MKVYIIIRHIDYEGDDVVRVFDNEETATTVAEELNSKRYSYFGGHYAVHAWEVE